MGNEPSIQGTISSLNQEQLEETQNSLLNRYQFNNVNGKLKLNGTEVDPQEIRELLSNKNAQRVLLQKAFENGWENISCDQEEEQLVQTIHHLAPFEGSSELHSSNNNLTLANMQERGNTLSNPFPMKNEQFVQHLQKSGEQTQKDIFQSSVQDNSNYLPPLIPNTTAFNSNKQGNSSKNASLSFGVGYNPLTFQYKGFSRNQSHRSNQSDSVMQFHCDEFGSARTNLLNQQILSQGNQHNNSQNHYNTSRKFQESGQQLLTHIKETEDSVEKDYSGVEDIDAYIPELNFEVSANRRQIPQLEDSKNVFLQNGIEYCETNNFNFKDNIEEDQNHFQQKIKQSINHEFDENISQQANQQNTLPNNSSVYNYQGNLNEGCQQEVQKRHINLEQLIRSRQNSKQISEGLLSANIQESMCGFQSPLNVALVKNYLTLNESQLSSCNQNDLNQRQLDILRELVKEDHIIRTIQKTLQSQQNTSREALHNHHDHNQPSNIQRNQLINQCFQVPQQNNVQKQLQSAFERESNDLPRISAPISKPANNSTGLNSACSSRSNSLAIPLNDSTNYQLNQKNISLQYQQQENQNNNQTRQSRFQQNNNNNNQIKGNNQNFNLQNDYPQQIQNMNQENPANNSFRTTNQGNNNLKQTQNIKSDLFTKKEVIQNSFSNRMKQASNKEQFGLGEQMESSDNISQYNNNEGYSYRTNNSFKSNEQKRRSMSQNTNNQTNNRSTSSFGFGNDEKQSTEGQLQFQSINQINLNGLMNSSNIQSNTQNSMCFSGVQYKICTSVNKENVENPVKKIRSFSQNSRQSSILPKQPNILLKSQNQASQNQFINNRINLEQNQPMVNVFNTSNQNFGNQNDFKTTNNTLFIQPNQIIPNNQNINATNSNNNVNNSQIVGDVVQSGSNQIIPSSNKSIKEISNIFYNINNSMNNSMNGGLNSSYGDCLNVNQSFEKKFRKLRSVSHSDNRNSLRSNGNNQQNQQQLLNISNYQGDNYCQNSQQNLQMQEETQISNQFQSQGQQQYYSILNGISSVNTYIQNNTQNSFLQNQQLTMHTTEQNACQTEISDHLNNCSNNLSVDATNKQFNKQQFYNNGQESTNSQKSSGFRGTNINYDSQNRGRNNNQIVSFSSSNRMRFMTILEQTENSNYPSINSQQIQQQQILNSRQSIISSQNERQSKILTVENEKEGCNYSENQQQHNKNQNFIDTKANNCMNDDEIKNKIYFNYNNENNNEQNNFQKQINISQHGFLNCKNVQSIQNTPISKSQQDSNSSRIVSRMNFQQQSNFNQQDQNHDESQSFSNQIYDNEILEQKPSINFNLQQENENGDERLTYERNLNSNNQKDQNKSSVKILNESHIQHTSKKRLSISNNNSYQYTPSKQVSVNIVLNEGEDQLHNTPNQIKNLQKQIPRLYEKSIVQSQDNSFINNHPYQIRSISNDSKFIDQSKIFNNSQEQGLTRKIITGIKKNQNNTNSNNNSFAQQSQSNQDQSYLSKNQYQDSSLSKYSMKQQQLNEQISQQELQLNEGNEQITQASNIKQNIFTNNQNENSFSSYYEKQLSLEKAQNSRIKSQQLSILEGNSNKQTVLNTEVTQINFENTFNGNQSQKSLQESSIYQRNRNLIEQIKQNNKDIFKETNNSYQNNQTFEIEEEHQQESDVKQNQKFEQLFGFCNDHTNKKDNTVNQSSPIKNQNKLQQQSSQKDKNTSHQYSDNKYKRSDLKLNDSIDFNKNKIENDNDEYYYSKIHQLNLNTQLTNESQEKLKEMMKRMKQPQQKAIDNMNQQNEQRLENSLPSQNNFTNQISIPEENTRDDYISINQAIQSSLECLNQFQINNTQIYQMRKLENQQQQEQQDELYQIETNQITNNERSQEQQSSALKQRKIISEQENYNEMKENNLINQNNLQNKQEYQENQSKTFYLDTFKQQYFEEEEKQEANNVEQEDQSNYYRDQELQNEIEQEQLNNLNSNEQFELQRNEMSQCLTETSRKDNQCLDEISQHLIYLKQRSKNMDTSIQSEINNLEDKIARIFTKIKHEKNSRSKENTFLMSVNENSSNKLLSNMPPSVSNSHSSINNPNYNKSYQFYPKKSITTASNSQMSSKFHSQINQINTSQQEILSQQQLQQNQQPYSLMSENNLMQQYQSADYEDEFLNNDKIMPIDQALALEQPEAQFGEVSIETLRTNRGQVVNSSNNIVDMKQDNNSRNSLHLQKGVMMRQNEYQNCNFNFTNNQSVSHQIEEPYEMNEEQNQVYQIQNGYYKQQQFADNQNQQMDNLQCKNVSSIDYQMEQSQGNSDQYNNYQFSNGNQQQFCDYFENQVEENYLNQQPQLQQQQSSLSQQSNNNNSSSNKHKQQFQINQIQNNGVVNNNSSNRSSIRSNLNSNNNNNFNSSKYLSQAERQKKDLELLKIMHILEENPNNVINSIKQFETLDSQQLKNEIATQRQSYSDFEQQQQLPSNSSEKVISSSYKANQFVSYQPLQINTNLQQLIQNNSNQQKVFSSQQLLYQNNEQEYEQQAAFFQNQSYSCQPPLFEMSQQEWQNSSASFPNNNTNNQGQIINMMNNYQDISGNQYYYGNEFYNENGKIIEDQYDQQYQNIHQFRQSDRQTQEYKNGYSNRNSKKDQSNKENKIPEQKVNLMELLQKKQQQHQDQIQQQFSQKRTLQTLQEQSINIQLDFNTPIISTKSNQTHVSKFKNDQIENEQNYAIPSLKNNSRQSLYQKQYKNNLNENVSINHSVSENNISFTPDKYQPSISVSGNSSKINTAKKIQNNKSSQRLVNQGTLQNHLEYKEDQDLRNQQRQKTHDKITQLYNQHKNFILKQEKLNHEQELQNSSSSQNYWRIRNAETRKRSRNSSNSGPRSSGKEKSNTKDNERNPKHQLTEIVNFLNEQQKMNKPLFDIIKQSSLPQTKVMNNNNNNNNQNIQFSSTTQSTKYRQNKQQNFNHYYQ